MTKVLALSELRRVAERTRMVKVPAERFKVQGSSTSEAAKPSARFKDPSAIVHQTSDFVEVQERIPWRVWYCAASNGDMILGEECVTLSVDVPPNCPGAYPSRLVQFTSSGQTRRLRDVCILRADDFDLIV